MIVSNLKGNAVSLICFENIPTTGSATTFGLITIKIISFSAFVPMSCVESIETIQLLHAVTVVSLIMIGKTTVIAGKVIKTI